MRNARKIEIFALVIFFAACGMQAILAFYSNVVSSESLESMRLKANIKELKDDNLSLNTQILQYTSLEYVSSRAGELGFVSAKSYISLFSPVQIAVTSSLD